MLNELNARPDIPFPNLAWFFFFLPRMSGLYSEIMSVKSRAENVFAHSNSCASSSSENEFFDEKCGGYRRFHLTMKKLERSNRDALVS